MTVGALTIRFFRRELEGRFQGSLSGGLWVLFQPLLQLAITAFVFEHIFKVRVPGMERTGYVTFLAVAMWPWTAFAEAILRSTTAIQDNASLIGKVAMPRAILVLARVGASFAVHLLGFLAVILVLWLTGQPIRFSGLPFAVFLYLPLGMLASGVSLVCAAIQVFIRDLVQLLGQLLPLLMFAAPVYYARAQFPDRYLIILDLNPFTFYAESFRSLLLGYGELDYGNLGIAVILAILVLIGGWMLFRRLDPHFEDFL